MKNNFCLRKIPLEDLINGLIEVYESGANYVDVIGETNRSRDTILIRTKDTYYSPLLHDKKDGKLTEDELNNLI